jgi:nitrate reductase cytochrome c-type subunit
MKVRNSIHSRKITTIVLSMLAIICCGACSEFAGKKKFTSQTQKEAEPLTPPTQEPEVEDRLYQFNFSKEKQPNIPHYLLMVIDNSVSMLNPNPNAGGKTYFQIFREGIQRVAVKHPDVRFGTITTMVHEPGKIGTIYQRIHTYSGMEFEPGFTALIDAAGIKKFLDQSGIPAEVRNLFPLSGCESSWVTHGQKNQLGQSCLESIMQISHFPVGPEPGGLALKQFVDRNAGQGVPKGSFFQVVFISDEPNPGYAQQRLIDLCPTADELTASIQSAYQPHGIRIHGIVRSKAGSKTITNSHSVPFVEDRGLTLNVEKCQYQHAIEKTGGTEVDIVSATHYDGLVDAIIKPMDESVLIQHTLPAEVQTIKRILVNAKDMTSAHSRSTSGELEIRFQALESSFDVEVYYE